MLVALLVRVASWPRYANPCMINTINLGRINEIAITDYSPKHATTLGAGGGGHASQPVRAANVGWHMLNLSAQTITTPARDQHYSR